MENLIVIMFMLLNIIFVLTTINLIRYNKQYKYILDKTIDKIVRKIDNEIQDKKQIVRVVNEIGRQVELLSQSKGKKIITKEEIENLKKELKGIKKRGYRFQVSKILDKEGQHLIIEMTKKDVVVKTFNNIQELREHLDNNK